MIRLAGRFPEAPTPRVRPVYKDNASGLGIGQHEALIDDGNEYVTDDHDRIFTTADEDEG